MYVGIWPTYISWYVSGTCRGQKNALDLLEVELQTASANLNPLEEHPMLLTIEVSLQPLN